MGKQGPLLNNRCASNGGRELRQRSQLKIPRKPRKKLSCGARARCKCNKNWSDACRSGRICRNPLAEHGMILNWRRIYAHKIDLATPWLNILPRKNGNLPAPRSPNTVGLHPLPIDLIFLRATDGMALIALMDGRRLGSNCKRLIRFHTIMPSEKLPKICDISAYKLYHYPWKK